MGISTMLLINDDTEDAVQMQERLPENLEIQIASQAAAQLLQSYNFDFIVIDNDANDLKVAKGPETLKRIIEVGTSARIFYTSFQPGWVGSDVHKNRLVQVVKTDELLDILAKEFYFELRPAPTKDETDPQITLIISYNPIEGYEEGVYCDGKLIILSFPKNAGDKAQRVLRQKLQEIYRTFEWRTDRDLIKNIFVYDGVNGNDWPARLASALGHDVRMKVQLVACHCDWKRKVRDASTYYVDLHKCECSGSTTLGAIADMILGVIRPKINYATIPVPRKTIENGAERYSV
ncbi:hypothetical protein HN858_05110 [Candidatus Falkowbacteria bacterium]|jgi:hypothetical protein|nr:hypothetical protein [Candidatus Falkowbacteria bacterium]MBT5502585.1 hypothetical protein [Candidatus Falkowbacteria bacterium]MBT6574606.1 hypothetical protein [Candidatus Falkowbacteria bacterium]MBT7349017.1 hypothetical protein [Candidatus Falkowbacteria bacterium]MBT7500359.1 hypothetical protein [Candidatus Falkowbacteria bacterium]